MEMAEELQEILNWADDDAYVTPGADNLIRALIDDLKDLEQ